MGDRFGISFLPSTVSAPTFEVYSPDYKACSFTVIVRRKSGCFQSFQHYDTGEGYSIALIKGPHDNRVFGGKGSKLKKST